MLFLLDISFLIQVDGCKLPYVIEICNCIYIFEKLLIKFPLLLLLLLLSLSPLLFNMAFKYLQSTY